VGIAEEDRPEMCFFTFVPTTESVQPKIIYPTYEKLEKLKMYDTENENSFDPTQKLVLHREPSPNDLTI
jgi:hypothetical protein